MDQLQNIWMRMFENENKRDAWWHKKCTVYHQRGYEMLRVRGRGELYRILRYAPTAEHEYLMHLSILLKKRDHFYIEELSVPFVFNVERGNVVHHRICGISSADEETSPVLTREISPEAHQRFTYDRQAAVKYAERWWNSYNPAYRRFDVDCTNYVSQCLYAGGAPMHGAPKRDRGWWYQGDNWSYSWSVAHSLRWYLSGATQGLKGSEVSEASELELGDIICYDFQGDGRWDHNTIVVSKDNNGMPLVNAHTDNSRMRYWSYEDSLAWTPDTQYKFFHIG
ncbi:putative 35.5 kDa protein in gldA 3'region [Lentibacillus sp. JNUCC-1]|uniref:amidase domain-containing protein n=1 Tax=Lentibacillus sp. JNUCC-1 TaxID=2654513 RepID=UPI001320DC3A|nr:amidase domain-containing protein [Lentibacillus sp. JNUCC-1]MUV36661.1 putative 35.5 kDa protein in gldA 3'region [Lentibacillus sp. JNUCC-1]